MKNCRPTRFFFTTLMTLLAVTAVSQFACLAAADSVPVYSLAMPEEYINYTVCWVNGSLWAKVDGIYPIAKTVIENQNQSDADISTLSTFDSDTILMVYPIPPATTNISIKVDETELGWSNYTQTFPDALHYTAIGNWSMIASTLYPVLDEFTLKIHYEHPIAQINGSYSFLYDLNISPYLSPWSNKSTAHFTIRFETEIADLKAATIATDATMSPVEYSSTKEGTTETVTLQVVSEYSKPLPGDLLITFAENNETEQTGSSLSLEQGCAIVAMTAIIVIVVFYTFIKYKKRNHSN